MKYELKTKKICNFIFKLKKIKYMNKNVMHNYKQNNSKIKCISFLDNQN